LERPLKPPRARAAFAFRCSPGARALRNDLSYATGILIAPLPVPVEELVFDAQDDLLRRTIHAMPIRRRRRMPARTGFAEIRHQCARAADASTRVQAAGRHDLFATPAIPLINRHPQPEGGCAEHRQKGRHTDNRPSLRCHSPTCFLARGFPLQLSGAMARASRNTCTTVPVVKACTTAPPAPSTSAAPSRTSTPVMR